MMAYPANNSGAQAGGSEPTLRDDAKPHYWPSSSWIRLAAFAHPAARWRLVGSTDDGSCAVRVGFDLVRCVWFSAPHADSMTRVRGAPFLARLP